MATCTGKQSVLDEMKKNFDFWILFNIMLLAITAVVSLCSSWWVTNFIPLNTFTIGQIKLMVFFSNWQSIIWAMLTIITIVNIKRFLKLR